ncbi:MAG: hypothetical protein RLZZ245_2457 [Verrucomicrobiota bacterium]|jgi:hypothetical protein
MNWILDNLQIVIIVVLALGSWLSSRMEAKKKAQEEMEYEETYEPEPEPAPMPRPQASVPPPLVRPVLRQTLPPELPTAAARYEAAAEAASVLKHQRDLEERLRQIRETKANTTGGAAATRNRLASKGQPTPRPSAATLPSIRSSIRKRSELRRDIVMREVLGSPLGLR